MGDNSKLIFWRPADGNGRLVFGDANDAAATPDAVFSADAELPGLDVGGPLRYAARLSSAADLPGLDVAGALAWDSNVARPLMGQATSRYQRARGIAAGARSRWQHSERVAAAVGTRWQLAVGLAVPVMARWQQSQALRSAASARYQHALGLLAQAGSRYQYAAALRAFAIGRYQHAQPIAVQASSSYQHMLPLRPAARGRYQIAQPIASPAYGRFRGAVPVGIGIRNRYQIAWWPQAGMHPPLVPPGVDPRDPCYDPATLARLVFEDGWADDGRLVFVCVGHGVQPPGTIVVLPRRSYLVINSIELRRADDLSGPPLPSEAFGMTLDADSWTWSWSATFGRAARDAVAPGPDGAPVEIEARVNGQPFRLQAERIGRSVRFPERLVKVSGRGKAALLDAPHAAVQSFGNTAARSAHQLMQDVLTINGVGIGWTVDWGLTDWPVPAGVWTHQGTWASALNDIAGAAGGYVQPHDTAATLRVLPRWPKPWWEWASATPDIELPAGIAEVEETEWIDKPAYDRVIVHGALGGVRGNFKRAGTAGEVLRPMVVHPLITHADVVRQRAIAELSDSGRLINQTLTLMVLPETGVIKPGTLLRYTDDDGAPRLGLVRSTGINWSFPVLTQTIGVEGHA